MVQLIVIFSVADVDDEDSDDDEDDDIIITTKKSNRPLQQQYQHCTMTNFIFD